MRRHIKRVHAIFDRRRLAFADALQNELGDLASFDTPTGGLAFWVRFAEDFDIAKLEQRWPQGTPQFLTSTQCTINGKAKPAARLGFASLDAHEMQTTIERLRDAVEER